MLITVLEVKAVWGQHPLQCYLFEFKYFVTLKSWWEEEAVKSRRVEIGGEQILRSSDGCEPSLVGGATQLDIKDDQYP